jgi:hypothetical protein
VTNKNVVPNIPIYLHEKIHNFLRSLSIFPRIQFNSVLNEKCFGLKKSFSLRGTNSVSRPKSAKQNWPTPALSLCTAATKWAWVPVWPTSQWHSLCAGPIDQGILNLDSPVAHVSLRSRQSATVVPRPVASVPTAAIVGLCRMCARHLGPACPLAW